MIILWDHRLSCLRISLSVLHQTDESRVAGLDLLWQEVIVMSSMKCRYNRTSLLSSYMVCDVIGKIKYLLEVYWLYGDIRQVEHSLCSLINYVRTFLIKSRNIFTKPSSRKNFDFLWHFRKNWHIRCIVVISYIHFAINIQEF